MTPRCRICGGAERVSRFAWFGYYRVHCVNGHRSKIATAKRATANWARLGGNRE